MQPWKLLKYNKNHDFINLLKLIRKIFDILRQKIVEIFNASESKIFTIGPQVEAKIR